MKQINTYHKNQRVRIFKRSIWWHARHRPDWSISYSHFNGQPNSWIKIRYRFTGQMLVGARQ